MASTRSPLCLSEGQGISFLQTELGQRPKVDEHTNFSLVCAGRNQHLHHAIDEQVPGPERLDSTGSRKIVPNFLSWFFSRSRIVFSFHCRSWCRRSQRVVVLVAGRGAREGMVNAGFVKGREVRVVVVRAGGEVCDLRTLQRQLILDKMFHSLCSHRVVPSREPILKRVNQSVRLDPS